MNSDGRNTSFSFSKFAGVATATAWTLGWVDVAGFAADHLNTTGGGAAWFNLIVTIAGIAFGSLMAFRLYPRGPERHAAQAYPTKPWYRRIAGWFGATVWCAAGAAWNLAVFGILAQSAIKGQSLNFVILTPFSLIGLFLLLVLFTGITLVLDTVFRLGDSTPTPPSASAELANEPPAPPPLTNSESVDAARSSSPAQGGECESGFSLRKSPVLGTLVLLVFLNWFLFAGLDIYWGGDALGTLPSRDGFVLTSHGHHTAVSESLWVFSLFYAGATLLLSPLVVFLFAARQVGVRRLQTAKWPLKLFVGVFLLVWVIGWYSSVGGSFHRSFQNWQRLKNGIHARASCAQTYRFVRGLSARMFRFGQEKNADKDSSAFICG